MDPLIRCPRCWKHVSDQARFCPRCGSGLAGGKAAYIPAPADPPRTPERIGGGGATTFLLFLLLSALGTVGMLVFGLTTRAPVLVRPAAPPAQLVPSPSDPSTPYDNADRNSYSSGPNDPATPYPPAPPAPAYPVRPRFIYPSPPMPPAPPRVHEPRRHERDRDDGWGR